MSHFGLPSSAGRMRQLGHPDWPWGPFDEAFGLVVVEVWMNYFVKKYLNYFVLRD